MTIPISRNQKITDAGTVYGIMSAILKAEEEIDRGKEHFWSIGLDAKNKLQYIELVSLGTLTNSLVHPRETFRYAVIHGGVASIIICHNHPSGDSSPSREDILITERLIQAGEILGIKVLDHVIIGDGYASLKEQGKLA